MGAARGSLELAWQALERRGATVRRRDLDAVSDFQCRALLYMAKWRLRCLDEGENAGWWPRKGQPA